LETKCPGKEFFRSLRDVADVDQVNTATSESVHDIPRVSDATSDSANVPTVESVDVASVITDAEMESDRLKSTVDSEVAVALRDLLPSLKNITRKSQLISAIYQLRSSLPVQKGGAISVQPTSTAR